MTKKVLIYVSFFILLGIQAKGAELDENSEHTKNEGIGKFIYGNFRMPMAYYSLKEHYASSLEHPRAFVLGNDRVNDNNNQNLNLAFKGKINHQYEFTSGLVFNPLFTPKGEGSLEAQVRMFGELKLYNNDGVFKLRVGNFLLPTLTSFTYKSPTLNWFQGRLSSVFERFQYADIRNGFTRYKDYLNDVELSSQNFSEGFVENGARNLNGVSFQGTLTNSLNVKAIYGKSVYNVSSQTIENDYKPSFLYGAMCNYQLTNRLVLGLASVQNINYLSAQEDVKERTQTYAMTSDVRLKFGSIETEFAYNKHAAKQWGEALLFNFNIEQYKSVLPFSVILGVHRISPNFISQSTEVLMNTNTSLTFNPNLPNKSTISEIDHLNNNSQGVKVQLTSVLTPNITHRKDMLKLYLGWQARKEIQKSNQGFNYFHRINGFILGKLFGFNAGPYDRFTSLFWEYVESVDQLDTSAVSTTDKAFTNIEAKMTYYGKVRKRDFLFNYVFYGASAQRNWSFGLKTKGEYLHIIAHDIESVWNICPKVNVLQYMGYQHSKGHELTEVNTLNENGTIASLKPRDQHEYQIGLGIEYNVFNRATLSLRNQWFWHQDKNFADDKYAGSYTLLEYKINF